MSTAETEVKKEIEVKKETEVKKEIEVKKETEVEKETEVKKEIEVKKETEEIKETKDETKESENPEKTTIETKPKKGALLGHRILRDFSQDYNKKTPIYFIGIITEYQPSPNPTDLQSLFPSKKKQSLDNGLYRIRYLDKDKDEVSPAEAYAGINLYNTFLDSNQKRKVHTKDLNSFFDYEKYPNPNNFLMNDLVNEEKYYYETYKEYLEENEIKPSKTLVVPLNESVGDGEVVLTEFGYVAERVFGEGMSRFEVTPKKRGRKKGYTPVAKRKRSPAKATSSKRLKSRKSPKAEDVEKDNNGSKTDITASSEPMDVETRPPQDINSTKEDVETKPPQDINSKESKDADEQLEDVETNKPQESIKESTKESKDTVKLEKPESPTNAKSQENESQNDKADEKEELKKVNQELKEVDEQLEKEKSVSSPKTSQHIDQVTKSQDEKYKNDKADKAQDPKADSKEQVDAKKDAKATETGANVQDKTKSNDTKSNDVNKPEEKDV